MAERRHCAVGKPAGRRFSRAGPGTTHRGDPRSNAGERACRATARHRVVGQSLLLPFCWAGTPAFEKGSRRKGETLSGRYRSNGYALRQPISHRASCDAPRITVAHGSINASSAERGASLAAFPRRAWERSIDGTPPGACSLYRGSRFTRNSQVGFKAASLCC